MKGESKPSRVAGKHYIARTGIKLHQVNLNIFLVVFLVGSLRGSPRGYLTGFSRWYLREFLVGSARHERE